MAVVEDLVSHVPVMYSAATRCCAPLLDVMPSRAPFCHMALHCVCIPASGSAPFRPSCLPHARTVGFIRFCAEMPETTGGRTVLARRSLPLHGGSQKTR